MTTLSFEDWLYRKADQYAHNEILAFQMMVLGMVSLVGGLIVTVVMTGQLLLIPMVDQHPLNPSSSVGLILTTVGSLVLSVGFAMALYYDRKRSWHVNEIEKSNRLKNRKIDIDVVKERIAVLDKGEKLARVGRRHDKRSK